MPNVEHCPRCNGRGTLGGATQSAIVAKHTCDMCEGSGSVVPSGMGDIEHARHPETWPCDCCGRNRDDTTVFVDGTRLCPDCELPLVRQQLKGAVDLLATFVDNDPCSLDHHGYCQTHNWLTEGECNVARARRLVGGGR